MRLGFAIAGAVIVLSMAGATVGIGMVQVHHIATVVRHYGHVEPFRRGTITPPPSGKPQTLLLVGSDRRYGDARGDAHSDTLMLVRLDPTQSATTVLSIPRDLRVTIPGHGIDKVNAAYGEGGLDLTTRTVKQLLSTPGRRFRVNHAIAINFKGFRDAVDIVNCVYIDVDRRYYHSNLWRADGLALRRDRRPAPATSGYAGSKALDYVRFRHLDNDIVRAARQQDFLRPGERPAELPAACCCNLNPLVKALFREGHVLVTRKGPADQLAASCGLLRLAASLHRAGRCGRSASPHTFVQSAPRATVPTTESPLAATTAPIGLGDYVTATPDQIQRSVRAVPCILRLRAPIAALPRQGEESAAASGAPASAPQAMGSSTALSAAKAIARPAIAHRHFKLPFYAPAWLTRRGSLPREHGRRALSPRLLCDPRTVAAAAIRPYRLVVVGGRDCRGSTTASKGTSLWHTRLILDGSHCRARGWAGRSYSGVHVGPAYPPRRLAHLYTAPTGCRTPSAATCPTARCSVIARSLLAHPRRLRHRSQLIRTSTRPGKRPSRSSRRSEISRCVPSARVRVTPASRSSRRW